MESSLFRNQKTMRKEEKPARRTRRSFLKTSAMGSIGSKSALIFSGLVVTTYASGGPLYELSECGDTGAGPICSKDGGNPDRWICTVECGDELASHTAVCSGRLGPITECPAS